MIRKIYIYPQFYLKLYSLPNRNPCLKVNHDSLQLTLQILDGSFRYA